MENQKQETADSSKCFITEKLDELSFGSKAGVVVTAVYLAGLGWWMYEKWDKFSAMEPNSWGDYLAGTFGPLAFLWLVLGYFQQGHELRQNSEALKLQALELHNSVEQQKELAISAQKQLTQFLENHRANLKVTFNFFAKAPGHWDIEFVQITILNLGYRCTNLVATIPNAAEDSQHRDYSTKWIVSDSLELNEKVADEFVFPLTEYLEPDYLTVQYRDGTGEDVTLRWLIAKDGEELLHFTRIP